ncbi:MAG: DUF4358 domain-containing protein [Clostridia bacterium]|nr:DUF4358 domain-containing protein [Clostridia bacterium]
MKKIFCTLMILSLLLVFCACAGNGDTTTTTSNVNANVDLKAVMTEIEGAVTLPENMDDITATDLLMQYYGIKEQDVKQFAVKINGTGIQCDEIVMVEATDADALERIKTSLNNRLEDVKNQMNNYLPDQYQIAAACKVETKGNYVTLFISSDATRMAEIFGSKF